MAIQRRLTKLFIHRFILLYISLLVIVGITFIFFGKTLSEKEPSISLTRATNEYMYPRVSITNNQVFIDASIIETVKKENGWIQIIKPDGEVIRSVDVPGDVPLKYSYGDIERIVNGQFGSPYSYYYWITDQNYIILYGLPSESSAILQQLMQVNVTSLNDMPAALKNEIIEKKAWVEILNPDGKVLESFNAKDVVSFTKVDLLKAKKDPGSFPYEVSSQLQGQNVMVVGWPNKIKNPNEQFDLYMGSWFILVVLILPLILGAFVLLFAFIFGQKIGKPILHIMNWIDHLSSNKYYEPKNKKGIPASLKKNGEIKKSFRIFRDVIDSLESLTNTLQWNSDERKNIEKTREEWITGLSHDLRTPLSSIMGYGTILELGNYDWDKQEIIEIGRILNKKTEYMNALIEDLNITYQLKNNALPIKRIRENVGQHLIQVIANILNHPLYEKRNIEYHDESNQAIFYSIDSKWFQRIIENLVINAVKHNPESTCIQVFLKQEKESFMIIIKDNGIGMDKETQKNLFDRYYRGTSTTTDQRGSGLGLAITNQLVRAHGGKITVESHPGQGTKVTILFRLVT